MQRSPEAAPAATGVLARCVALGIVYSAAHMLALVLLGPLARQQPSLADTLVFWITGTLLCFVLAPLIAHSAWSKLDTVLAVWAAMLLVRSIGTGIEGSLFRPAARDLVVAGAIADAGIAMLMAWLAVTVFLPTPLEPHTQTAPTRSWWGWVWRVLLVGVAYFVFYFGFGAANAFLYTLPFYKENPQYGLNLPPVRVVALAQMIRGPLFGLGSLFIARAVDMPRRRTAIWLGLLLFVLGGVAPYVENTFRSMPLGFNLATLAELFLQNFSTGVVAAVLYKPRPRLTD